MSCSSLPDAAVSDLTGLMLLQDPFALLNHVRAQLHAILAALCSGGDKFCPWPAPPSEADVESVVKLLQQADKSLKNKCSTYAVSA